MTPLSDPCTRRLLDVARALTDPFDLPHLLGRILETVLELTAAERGFISTGDATYAIPGDAPGPSRTLLDVAWRSPRPFCVADAQEVFSTSDSVVTQRVRSVCAVPLRDGREVLGVLCLDHTERPALFSNADLEVLSALGSLAAVALRESRRAAELARRVTSQERELSRRRGPFDGIIARSRSMRGLLDRVRRMSGVPYPVFIHGESGTGKELIARALHAGPGPFVAANCAAIPESLAESVCFGHTRGAFTGADRDQAGLFEQAHGGTLFLDEVEAMPASLQEKLLRVIQDGEVRRIGARASRQVAVRLVSASNEDLNRLVGAGRFRADLLYRLNVLRLDVPALRDHIEDVPRLAEHFLDRYAKDTGRSRPRLSAGAMHLLCRHDWPGNVRQLQNAVWQAASLARGDLLEPSDFDFLHAPPAPEPAGPILSIEEYIRRAVLAHEGRLTLAEIARRLGVSRKKLWQRRKRWEIHLPASRGTE
ncbi:MAG: sigma-54-dependent Fis family transcriptional regulator [Planctomycetes bacterium]|nr:sigma-54-dependent Fis family transcriptional regulator [Planctomycetota bacterium]